MPPVVRLLAGILPVFTFETFEVPIPETAAAVLRILAPVVVLWSSCIQLFWAAGLAQYGEAKNRPIEEYSGEEEKKTREEEKKTQEKKTWRLLMLAFFLQLGPWVSFIIASFALDATWGIAIGAACLAPIVLGDLVKLVWRRSWDAVD
jgi:hypothetical protein